MTHDHVEQTGQRSLGLGTETELCFLDASFHQSYDPVGLLGQPVIVGDHDYSDVLLLVQGSQNPQDFFSIFAIEIARRFIGQ